MAARTWSARCLVVSLLLYCSLYELLPWAWLLVPFVTATVLRACTRQPLVLVLAAVLCHLLGPPQWLLWHADYNEPFYQEQAPSNWIAGLLLWGLGWGLGSALNWTARSRRTLGLVVALTSLLAFPWRALDLSPSLLPTLDTPPAPGFVFDGQQQLKAFHLYQKGATYYEANLVAFQEDGRHFAKGFAGLSVRSPLLFWMLGVLPGPSTVAWVGWFLAMATALTVYLASRRVADPLLSLPAPSAILCLYLYVQTNYWLFIQDPWATLALLLGLAGMLLKPRSWWVAPALGLAFAIREFNGLLLVLLMAWDLKQRHTRRFGLSLLMLLLCFGLYHYNRVESARVIGMEAIPLWSRIQFSPTFVATTWRFGSILLLGRDLWMPVLFVLALGAPFLNRRAPVALLSLQAWCLSSIFLFLGFGGSYYSYNTMPVAAWAAILGLAAQEWPGPATKVASR